MSKREATIYLLFIITLTMIIGAIFSADPEPRTGMCVGENFTDHCGEILEQEWSP